MAITAVNSGQGHATGNATSFTLTSQNTGVCDLLVVAVICENTDANDTITGVSFNSNNLFEIVSRGGSGVNENASIWAISGANASGTASIVVNTSNNKQQLVQWKSYNGTKAMTSSADTDGFGSATATTGTSLAISWTANNADSWSFVSVDTNSSSTTNVQNMGLILNNAPFQGMIYDTGGTVGTTGVKTYTATASVSTSWNLVGFSFAPAGAVANATSPNLMIMGV